MKVKVFCLWQKNNGGWGSITILRVNLKNACKIFFLANSFVGSLLWMSIWFGRGRVVVGPNAFGNGSFAS